MRSAVWDQRSDPEINRQEGIEFTPLQNNFEVLALNKNISKIHSDGETFTKRVIKYPVHTLL